MATKLISFRINPHLNDAIEERIKALGLPKAGDYMKSLVRYDLLVAKPHRATGELFKMSDTQQDSFDCNLTGLFLAGATADGTYFERSLAKIVEELGAPGEPSQDQITTRINDLLGGGK